MSYAQMQLNGMSILDKAKSVVTGPRRDFYGPPSENHERTAKMWSAYLGMDLVPRDVCMLNVLQKVSRDAYRPQNDNLVDIAGWAENAYLCEPSAMLEGANEDDGA